MASWYRISETDPAGKVASFVLGVVALVCGFVAMSEVTDAKTIIRLVG
jgi:hypothetical protein